MALKPHFPHSYDAGCPLSHALANAETESSDAVSLDDSDAIRVYELRRPSNPHAHTTSASTNTRSLTREWGLGGGRGPRVCVWIGRRPRLCGSGAAAGRRSCAG